jgi:hypothetical protein
LSFLAHARARGTLARMEALRSLLVLAAIATGSAQALAEPAAADAACAHKGARLRPGPRHNDLRQGRRTGGRRGRCCGRRSGGRGCAQAGQSRSTSAATPRSGRCAASSASVSVRAGSVNARRRRAPARCPSESGRMRIFAVRAGMSRARALRRSPCGSLLSSCLLPWPRCLRNAAADRRHRNGRCGGSDCGGTGRSGRRRRCGGGDHRAAGYRRVYRGGPRRVYHRRYYYR